MIKSKFFPLAMNLLYGLQITIWPSVLDIKPDYSRDRFVLQPYSRLDIRGILLGPFPGHLFLTNPVLAIIHCVPLVLSWFSWEQGFYNFPEACGIKLMAPHGQCSMQCVLVKTGSLNQPKNWKEALKWGCLEGCLYKKVFEATTYWWKWLLDEFFVNLTGFLVNCFIW